MSGVLRMHDVELRARGQADVLARDGQVARLGGLDAKAQRVASTMAYNMPP